MNETELATFVESLRAKLDDETFTSDDAYGEIWLSENDLTYEQKQEVHKTLEIPDEMPAQLELIVTAPFTGRIDSDV